MRTTKTVGDRRRARGPGRGGVPGPGGSVVRPRREGARAGRPRLPRRRATASRWNLGAHALYRGGAAHEVLRELGVRFTGAPPSQSGALALDRGALHPLPSGALSLSDRPPPPRREDRDGARPWQPRRGEPRAARVRVPVSAWLRDAFRTPECAPLRRRARPAVDLLRRRRSPERRRGARAGAARPEPRRALPRRRLEDPRRRPARAPPCGRRGDPQRRARGAESRPRAAPSPAVELADGDRLGAGAVLIAASLARRGRASRPRPALAAHAERALPVRAACLDIALSRPPSPAPGLRARHRSAALPLGALRRRAARARGRRRDPRRPVRAPSSPAARPSASSKVCSIARSPATATLIVERRFLPSLIVSHAVVTARAAAPQGGPAPASRRSRRASSSRATGSGRRACSPTRASPARGPPRGPPLAPRARPRGVTEPPDAPCAAPRPLPAPSAGARRPRLRRREPAASTGASSGPSPTGSPAAPPTRTTSCRRRSAARPRAPARAHRPSPSARGSSASRSTSAAIPSGAASAAALRRTVAPSPIEADESPSLVVRDPRQGRHRGPLRPPRERLLRLPPRARGAHAPPARGAPAPRRLRLSGAGGRRRARPLRGQRRRPPTTAPAAPSRPYDRDRCHPSPELVERSRRGARALPADPGDAGRRRDRGAAGRGRPGRQRRERRVQGGAPDHRRPEPGRAVLRRPAEDRRPRCSATSCAHQRPPAVVIQRASTVEKLAPRVRLLRCEIDASGLITAIPPCWPRPKLTAMKRSLRRTRGARRRDRQVSSEEIAPAGRALE